MLHGRSGSTVGQTLYLMTLTVQKFLDTLGEDDFVQVATVSILTQPLSYHCKTQCIQVLHFMLYVSFCVNDYFPSPQNVNLKKGL